MFTQSQLISATARGITPRSLIPPFSEGPNQSEVNIRNLRVHYCLLSSGAHATCAGAVFGGLPQSAVAQVVSFRPLHGKRLASRPGTILGGAQSTPEQAYRVAHAGHFHRPGTIAQNRRPVAIDAVKSARASENRAELRLPLKTAAQLNHSP